MGEHEEARGVGGQNRGGADEGRCKGGVVDEVVENKTRYRCG